MIDFGETMGNARLLAENCLAQEKTLYKGHAVAAVAALNPHVAEEALDLIEVEYEPLPVILNALDAMRDDAPLLHEAMTTPLHRRALHPAATDTGVHSNVASHLQFKRGDLDEGFAKADVVVEREFTTSTVHQGYIEPHTSTARWDPDGHVTIWTSTQGAFGIRGQAAAILGVPEGKVTVIPMEIGGGFGAKTYVHVDPVAALLSRKSGAPVKVTMSRTEVLEATRAPPPLPPSAPGSAPPTTATSPLPSSGWPTRRAPSPAPPSAPARPPPSRPTTSSTSWSMATTSS